MPLVIIKAEGKELMSVRFCDCEVCCGVDAAAQKDYGFFVLHLETVIPFSMGGGTAIYICHAEFISASYFPIDDDYRRS
jgi:hypothetical protein